MPENKTVLYKGSEIFYKVYGNKKPVLLLLHGFAETGAVWVYQTAYLQKKFAVIVPDLPGCGKSSALNIEAPKTTIADYAESVLAIIKKENITLYNLI